MANINWCGRCCSDCINGCSSSERIPCNLDCEGLQKKLIDIQYCISHGCLENLCYIYFGCFDKNRPKEEYVSELYNSYADNSGFGVYPY